MYDKFYVELGGLIKETRIKCKLDQKKLADKIGVSYNTISRWETGSIQIPTDKLKKVCKVLHCDYDVITFKATEKVAQSHQGNIQNIIDNETIRIPLYDSMNCDKPFTDEGLNQFITISSYLLDKKKNYFAFICSHNIFNFKIGDILVFEQTNEFNDDDIICANVKNIPNILLGYMNKLFGCECLGVLRRSIKTY